MRDALTEFRVGDDGALRLMCECAMDACEAMLELQDGEFAHARSVATWLVVAPDHVLAAADRVLERHEGHWVIERIR